ncbi:MULTISPECIES: phage baseplate upper protein [unclassified Mammaliicoccus]|uniref:phage baseplate upper protein n=1 Tax=unclassified Mammaliicoccus TaxID=2803851 RepID=UPI001EFBCDB1|nr:MULTISPECIES: phage baseplate upper protein [unclassified Mammaliicoccus]
MANQDLFFDITKQGSEQEKQQYIVSRVGDGGLKAITITVWSNGRPYNLTDLTPVFEGVKPDGERIIDTTGSIVLDPKNGVFRYVFPQQASTAEGQYQQAFFKLMRGEQTDSTLEININVLKNRVEFGVNSESYFTEYQKELERLRTVVTEGIARLEEQAEGTKTKISTQAETAKALDLQLKTLQSAISSNELVTKRDFEAMTTEIREQVNTFLSSIDTVKKSIERKVDAFDQTKMDANVIPGTLDDVANITKTGLYYFDSSTLNIPTRNTNNANGYIQAIMKDTENGMITMLGSGFAIEKYRGKLHGRWVTSVPVKLWDGKAKKGSTMTMRGSIRQFGELRFKVGFYSDRNATRTSEIVSDGQTIYLNQAGLRVSGNGFKNGHLEEIGIFIKDETHLVVSKTLIATGDADAVDSDAYIAAVYGIY